jgi:hypothetical protein
MDKSEEDEGGRRYSIPANQCNGDWPPKEIFEGYSLSDRLIVVNGRLGTLWAGR